MAKNSSQNPDKSISVQLVLTARLYRTRSAEMLATLGLFPGQDQVLQSMLRAEASSESDEGLRTTGIPMGDLAADLRVRAPTVSKTIARLSIQGLVERKTIGKDRRHVHVCLTEEGRTRAKAIEIIATKIEAEITDGLDSKERKRFRKLLRKVAKNLGSHHLEQVDEADELDD